MRSVLAVMFCLAASLGQGQTIRVQPFLQEAMPASIWVVWETTGGDQSRVLYGLSEDLGSVADGLSIPSQGDARIHQTRVTGLEPDTTYHYRVQTDGALSPVYRFRTPPAASAEQSSRFVLFSDTQRDAGNNNKFRELVNDGIIAYTSQNYGPELEKELDLVLVPGDLVNAGSVYGEWKTDFFDEGQNLFTSVPLYPALGNHEQDAHWYFDYMRLPENGTPGFMEHWYSVDHSNVRIITLDSNGAYRINEQLEWLDGVLAEAAIDDDIDFVVAQLHHPYLSEAWIAGNTPYTGEVVRRLEEFSRQTGKPSVHVFGHTHAYSRGQSRDHRHLWINVATGEGNIDYWGEFAQTDYDEFQKTFPDWGFAIMEIQAGDDPTLSFKRLSRGNEFEAKDNELMDELTIHRFAARPEKPDPLEPADGATGLDPDDTRLRASTFNDADSTVHLESHFQLSTEQGNYADPIDHWIRFENWYSPEDATGPGNGFYSVNTVTDPDVSRITIDRLQSQTIYYWRVRYRDDGLNWSDWSDETTFTTGRRLGSDNLLINPGGEFGTDGWIELVPPIESIRSGDCTAGDANSGLRFFAVGGVCANESAYGEAFQRVDVHEFADPIDSTLASAFFGGALRDWGGSDQPRAWLEYLDENLATLAQSQVLLSALPNWDDLDATSPIPATTRWIEFHISGTRNSGTDNDSYFDDLFLIVRVQSCPGDFDGDGDTDSSDFFAFLDAFVAGDSAADIDGDGTIDADDFFAYLDLFVQDCP